MNNLINLAEPIEHSRPKKFLVIIPIMIHLSKRRDNASVPGSVIINSSSGIVATFIHKRRINLE